MERVGFGPYRFEFESGRLWAGEDEVRLTPKAASVLKVLVTHAGRPVPKEQLFASVWSGTFVTDHALTSCIQELRKALEDDSRQPRFIETRHRRGYRFVAPVQSSEPEPVAAPPSPTPAPPEPPVGLDASAERTVVNERGEAPPRRADDLSAIAVLPFVDVSPEHDQDYLCDGLADELISALTRVEGLRVVARTASFLFRGSGADIPSIGRQLGVGTLLEGSVRKAGDRLRVTVQLVDTATGYHRWSERFDRRLDDVFAMQEEIAETVASSLRGDVLSGHEKEALTRPHTGAEAYECYLRGRHLLPRMTRPDLEQAASLFECAISHDPAYAPAWAGLATVHATLYEWFGAEDTDLDSADRASRRALELAPKLAEAHVARGCVLPLFRCYDEAEQAFEQAIRLNPRLFDGYYYFARTLLARGEVERAAALFGSATEVRAEDFQAPMYLAKTLEILGRHDAARQAAQEGIRRAEHSLAINPRDSRALSLGSLALFADGEEAKALAWSQRSLEINPDDVCTQVNSACLRARAGQREEALALLDRVFARGLGKRDWVDHDPDYDVLRDDPRFQTLVARLK